MPSSIVRPSFSEGQVLAAADLEAQTNYARVDSAIHERTEHIWGIASGLKLELTQEKAGNNGVRYGVPAIQPGVAVDPNGRRIVVVETRYLKESEFIGAGVYSRGAPAETKYPVYLVAIDTAKSTGRGAGRCATEISTQTEESFQIEIGAPGSEQTVNSKKGPASPAAVPPAGGKVLVGHVTWRERVVPNTNVGAFTGASPDGRVRYVGARASSVVPHQGVLSLLTSEADPRFVLRLLQDEQGGAELRFGRQTGSGDPSELFVVDDKGNVTIKGKIKSALPQAATMSGTIGHGLKLPLPPGITEDDVKQKRVSLHYLVSFRQQPQEKDFSGTKMPAIPIPLECWVDPDPEVRAVRCRCLWIATTGLGFLVDAGTADYMIVTRLEE